MTRWQSIKVREADVLKAVLRFLHIHPAVAWCERMNVGAQEINGRYVKFGFAGCSDIIGQTKAGLFMAIECKGPRGKLTTYQMIFLKRVERAGGVAIVARDVRDVAQVLDGLLRRKPDGVK